MLQYLDDIEFATKTIIHAIWQEYFEINNLEKEIVQLEIMTANKYNRADKLQQSEDIDDYMMGIGLMWDAYFTEDKDVYNKGKELQAKKQTYQTHEFAINSLSGSLLQIAKQGISIKYRGLAKCPNGRNIGTQSLKNVIWQARNQAIHFEDGNLNPQVVACFANLSIDVDQNFKCYRSFNMAFSVVKVLGWKTFEDFKNDMMQFA